MKCWRTCCAAIVAVLMTSVVVSASAVPDWISLDGVSRTGLQVEPIQLLSSSDRGVRLSGRFTGIEYLDVQTERGTFSRISIPGMGECRRIGEPVLPISRQIISVPLGATVSASVLSSTLQEIALADHGITHPILPAQPSLFKNQDPADVPFAYDEAAYAVSGYGDRPIVSVEELGVLRGVRLFAVVIEPVKYDPSRQTLAIYNDVEVEVTFSGGDMEATRYLRARTWSPYFEAAYSQYIVNYQDARRLDTDLTRYPIGMVIVSDPMFSSQLQPFINWKIEQGYKVIVGYTNNPSVGNTTTSIKAYLQGLYNAGTPEDPAPTFVIFVGDVAQIPAWTGQTETGHVTDVHYVRLDGLSDYMPEMYYGRFSAANTTDLQPQIDKTLEYERYLMPDPTYLGRVVMIAGMDASGHGYTHANGQINYGTSNYFNAAHGITSNTYLYPNSGSQDAAIIANASDGRGYINYTAHGSETSWGDPSFGISDINGLANNHKWGTVVGNCCLTNAFDTGTCFGEAWLRAASKGAIGYIGGTNSTLWDEDYYWGVGYRASIVENPTYSASARGAYDGMFHDHGETFPNWYTTQYGFIMAGNLAVVQSGSSNINYYWEIYSLMGDPSLTTFLGVPTANTVSYPEPILIGQSNITVTAEAYSYVGLSFGGALSAAGLVDATGSITLNFTPYTTPGYAHIVITRQGRIPVIDSIEVIPNAGPYVVTQSEQISDVAGGNGNGLADFGETLDISLTEKNVGTENATGVTVTISTSDPYLVISDNSEAYGNINAGQEVTMPNGFRAEVATNVPDGRVMTVNVVASDATHNWNDLFTIIGHAPSIEISSVIVHDATGDNDGRLDPGETAGIEVVLHNAGSAGAVSIATLLSSSDPYVVINDNSDNLTSLAGGASASVNYNVTASGSTPVGHPAAFNVAITATDYSASDQFTLSIGLSIEDWESGGFVSYPWQQGGTAPWVIVSASPYEGVYCAKSGTITHSQQSDLSVYLNVTAAGTISFYYKVSSEATYDFLRFLIDGVEQGSWSGTAGWAQASYAVSAGNHTFLWRYSKDGSLSSGSDCGWIDYIVFPPLGAIAYPDISLNPLSFDVGEDPGDTTSRPLTISNVGQATLDYSVIVNTDARAACTVPFVKLAKGEEDRREGVRGLDAHGGPDGYGYSWIDNDDAGGPTYSWVEISGSGTALTRTDDANFGPYALGFTFNYYGTDYTAVRICTNGWLTFTSTSNAYTNQGIPNTADPNNMIAPFWDDLSPNIAGNIYYLAQASPRRFIVEWVGVSHWNSSGTPTSPETFQVILNEDGTIVYQYQTVALGTSCTVGIENAAGTDGLQVVFNASYLRNGLAVCFNYTHPWLVVSPRSGSVPASGNAGLRVLFDATDLTDGTYTGTITVNSNDPDESSLNVPVTLTIGGPPDAVDDLTVYPVGTGVQLRWSAVSGAASYNVYRSDTWPVVIEPASLIGNTSGTSYDDNSELQSARFYVVTSVR